MHPNKHFVPSCFVRALAQWQMFNVTWLRCSTSVLVFDCWPIEHMTYLKLRNTWLLLQAKQINKMTTISLKMAKVSFWGNIVVILSVTQLVKTVIIFSAWDKSGDKDKQQQKTNTDVEDLNMYLKIISTQVVPSFASTLHLRLTNGTNTESFTALPFLVMVQNTQAFSLDWTMRTFGIGLCKLFSLHHQ